jgi:hypothetical protein
MVEVGLAVGVGVGSRWESELRCTGRDLNPYASRRRNLKTQLSATLTDARDVSATNEDERGRSRDALPRPAAVSARATMIAALTDAIERAALENDAHALCVAQDALRRLVDASTRNAQPSTAPPAKSPQRGA